MTELDWHRDYGPYEVEADTGNPYIRSKGWRSDYVPLGSLEGEGPRVEITHWLVVADEDARWGNSEEQTDWAWIQEQTECIQMEDGEFLDSRTDYDNLEGDWSYENKEHAFAALKAMAERDLSEYIGWNGE